MPSHYTLPKKSLYLALTGLLISPIAVAQDNPQFSQTVVFGDSLSDVGNFKELNPNISNFAGGFWNGVKGWLFGTNNPDVGIGQTFSTNPDLTWAGNLPPVTYGEPVVYAVGGAKAATDDPQSKLFGLVKPEIPSVKTQIDRYLDNQRADPNALYAVWIGSNDLMGLKGGDKELKLADVQVIETATQNQINQINRLQQAGARYILVPSVPNIGVTPEFNTSTDRQKISDGANHYNQTLYQGLQNQSNANVIPANTYALLNEVVENHESFGFKYGNGKNDRACKTAIGTEEKNWGCGKTEWQNPNANEEYVFADGIHPSGRTHRILSQYYQTLIETPTQMAQLPKYAVQAQTLRDEQLHRNLDNLDDGRFSIWADASTSNAKTHDGQKLNDPNIMLGMDVKGGSSRAGVYVIHNNQDYAPTPAIDAKMKTTSVGFYGQKDVGGFRVRANVGANDTKMDTKRGVVWEGQKRTHTAQTDASGINAGLQVSYGIQANNVTVRPHIGLHGQSLKVDTLSESEPHLSTAMAYDFDDRTSLHTRVGVDVAHQMSKRATLNVGVAHRREIGDNSEPHFVETRLPSLVSSYGYTDSYLMPVSADKTDSTTAHLGVRVDFGKVSMSAGVNANDINNETAVGGHVGMQASF